MAPIKLSRREREILDVLFELTGEASAEEIRERLTDPPSYSAVRAMLVKLEAKGAVRHKEKGLRYVYSPTTPRTAARRSALRRMVQVFFEGSPEKAATALLTQEAWSDRELDELALQIERARKERRS
ncbi:MAG: BlaI/MecI/CopY family transcriptional regulator [Acidobacteriota bacterium]